MSKKILITGTSRGIGLETVKILVDQGHEVLALSRNASPVRNLEMEKVHSLSFDITSVDDLERVSEFVKNRWGKVDILIHNAGAIVNKPFAEISTEEFKRVYEINVFGLAGLTRTVLPFMEKSGHVVMISSMGGVQGSIKFPGLSAYSSSKGAVITLTELRAEEYKESGPSFNALALGAVQTEMLREAFPGYQAPLQPEEMARYIVQFALEGNRLFNGKFLQVSSSTP